MKSFATILPLPGISELEGIARSLVRRLKELKYEDEKQASLAARLSSLIARSEEIGGLSDLHSQLCDIQTQLEKAIESGSRLRVVQAQQKLALWDVLDTQINRIVEDVLLRSVGQIQKTLLAHDTLPLIENKLSVIPSYEIVDQIELPLRENSAVRLQGITMHRRVGRLGKLSVTYKTFVSHLGASVASHVERELAYISRMLHSNVAVLAGVTQGYHGLNGYIVVTDGVHVVQFLEHAHAGDTLARYLEGMTSIYDTYGGTWAETITVDRSGHVTIYPSDDGWLFIEPGDMYNAEADPAMHMLIHAYGHSHRHLTPQRLHTLLQHCRTLSRGFNALQVAQILKISGIIPLPTHHCLDQQAARYPLSFTIRPGDFGSVASHTDISGSMISTWASLGNSSQLKNCIRTTDFYQSISVHTGPIRANRTEWISYNLAEELEADDDQVSHRVGLYLEDQVDWNWENVMAEALDISQRRNIALDNISLCWSISYWAELDIRSQDTISRRPSILYYHSNPRSDNLGDVWGFFSISADPKCQASRKAVEEWGWKTDYNGIEFRTYDVSKDWGRQHERLIEQGLPTIPGGFPSVDAEEAT